MTRQRAGCTPRRWSRELSENSLLQLAGFPKEDVLGKNPLLSTFPSWKRVGRVCQDLLWPQARGVGKPGRELAQVAWFPLSHGGLHSLIAPR